MLFNDWPYTSNFHRLLFKPEKPVRHQQTCPVCGRKLVNTYLRDGLWKFRRCWEVSSGGPPAQKSAALR